MNHSFRVSSRKRFGDLNPQLGDLITVQCAPEYVLPERSSVQVFHRDERVALVLRDVVNGADVGMIQCRSGARLALEPFQRRGICRQSLWQELQRDQAVDFLPPLSIHRASPAQPAEQPSLGQLQSRTTVSSETFRTSPVSSTFRPPNTRNSTT